MGVFLPQTRALALETPAGRGPAALPATWRPSHCCLVPSQGLGPSSWVRGILLHCLCLTETPSSAGQPWPAEVLGQLLGSLAPFVLKQNLTPVS